MIKYNLKELIAEKEFKEKEGFHSAKLQKRWEFLGQPSRKLLTIKDVIAPKRNMLKDYVSTLNAHQDSS